MKRPKRRVLYSNYDLCEFKEDAIEMCISRHLDDYPDEEDWKPSDEQVWDEIYFIDECNFDSFKMDCENFFNSNTFILQGYIGRWDGRHKGGFVFDSFREMSRAWDDCDYLEIYDENGHSYIQCSHHDGTDLYEIRLLNDKGYDYYARHQWYDDEEEVHNKLMKNPYSVLPNVAHKIYGCKRIEYENI